MTPTYEELLKGSTSWRFSHPSGLSYSLNHHGYRKYDPELPFMDAHPGTWCYYIHVSEEMYSHRWSDFACIRSEYGFEQPGPAWQHDWFDTEITWSSSEPYWNRKLNCGFDAVKIGCDYNHLWHREQGYWDTFDTVKRDAERTVDQFLAENPDYRTRCEYSGIWDEKNMFYTAINGKTCHNSIVEKLDPKWESWFPVKTD